MRPWAISATRTILCILLVTSGLAAAPARAAWPDTPLARLEALALLQTLNADLLSHDSATLTLDRWCARHKLAENPRIVADRVKGAHVPAPAEVRAQLRAGTDTPIAYRRVRLRCGDHVLSEADNWYVPSELTPEMNRTLETSDTPFGRVVQPLGFQRHTVSAQLLWSPLAVDWDIASPPLPPAKAGTVLPIPDAVIEHRALLTRADGDPFSYVVERYTGAVLDFPAPSVGLPVEAVDRRRAYVLTSSDQPERTDSGH